MNNNNQDNSQGIGSEISESLSELYHDADTDVSRRRICQSLGVIGVLNLAGCGGRESQPENPEDTSTSDGPPSRSEVEMSPNIASLIANHNEQLDGTDYTINIEYQGPSTGSDVSKQLTYLRESGSNASVALVSESTATDGINQFIHYISADTRTVEVELRDGSGSTIDMGVPDSVPTMTGSTVYDEYLLGAGLAEPYEQEMDSLEEPVNVYEIEVHRRLDIEQGKIIVSPDGVIQAFELEWVDDNDTMRWIEVETDDIGATVVDNPGS